MEPFKEGPVHRVAGVPEEAAELRLVDGAWGRFSLPQAPGVGGGLLLGLGCCRV